MAVVYVYKLLMNQKFSTVNYIIQHKKGEDKSFFLIDGQKNALFNVFVHLTLNCNSLAASQILFRLQLDPRLEYL
jgi:hypothetical protein